MNIQTSLYEGEEICLAPIDYEKDPEIESKWTHDASYLRLLDAAPACPLSVEQVKKNMKKLKKNRKTANPSYISRSENGRLSV